MIYLIPALTLSMLGYIAWLAVYRLRRDRISTERHLRRGKSGFRPKERIRFLLQRSFHVSKDKPEWEDPLVSRLAAAPPAGSAGAAEEPGRAER